jgi:hypothetical protein
MEPLRLIFELEGGAPEDETLAQYEALRDWVFLVFRASLMSAPIRTGNLINQSYITSDSEFSKTIVFSAPYASFVEDGRGEWGEPYFYPGRHFLQKAVVDNEDMFYYFLEKALQREFNVKEG